MKEIKEVVKRIRCELKSAEWYAEEALKDKVMYPVLAQQYHKLAIDGIQHVDELHAAATGLIEEFKRTGKQIPQGMLDLWEFEHQMLVEDVAEIQGTIKAFK